MNNFNIIQKGTSIILSYNFLYDESSVRDGLNDNSIHQNDLNYENLLNYVDRLYEKNKILRYEKLNGEKLYIYNKRKKKSYTLNIDEIYILFFENNMAFLNIELTYNGTNLEELYSINKHLTSFYSRADDQIFVAIGDKNFNRINIDLETFEKDLQENDQDILKKFTEDKDTLYNSNNQHLLNKELNYKIIKKINKITLNQNDGESLNSTYLELYTPKTKKDFPFDNSILKEFKERVGPTKEEKRSIALQNDTPDSNANQHYLYFENQQKLTKDMKKEQNKLRYIDYNTFITSLIIKYVKPNNGVFFYDNINFIATNYINSYITLSCSSENINSASENNFLYFEPLISSKTKRGLKITSPDYFNILQSQADIFTIGNSHNIVHILDDTIDTSIKERKKSDHFYTYQLSQLQRNSMLRIITASILNINDIAEEKLFLKKSKHIWQTFKMINKSIEDFKKFLTNINFSIISNSSSMDNSYQFFRKCNEVDILTSQWNTISFKFKNSKSTIEFILNESKFLFTAVTAGIILYTYWGSIIDLIHSLF